VYLYRNDFAQVYCPRYFHDCSHELRSKHKLEEDGTHKGEKHTPGLFMGERINHGVGDILMDGGDPFTVLQSPRRTFEKSDTGTVILCLVTVTFDLLTPK